MKSTVISGSLALDYLRAKGWKTGSEYGLWSRDPFIDLSLNRALAVELEREIIAKDIREALS